jgi:malate dehydrogenase (oxaloacetate-decarboxylating)
MTLDSRGLIVEGRPNLPPGKQKLALSIEAVKDWQIDDHPIGLRDVVRNARASVLIGVSGVPGMFNEETIRRMAQHAEHPIIMPLSNPTSHAEVTPSSAIEWTGGRAIVATGSPFPDVEYAGRTHKVGQANNVFVFPGMGLGVLAVGAREVTDRMFLAASKALANTVGSDLAAAGQLYPSISNVRSASLAVAKAVANQAIADGIADPMADVDQRIEEEMWFPEYLPYRAV